MTHTRDARGRHHLEQIRISSPCEIPWDSMRGDDRVRFCRSCRQSVYNVEAMTRAAAERLIAGREGRACVRMLWRPDGTVVTADCWSRLRAARRRGPIPFLATLVVVGWAQLAAMRFGLRAWHHAEPLTPPLARPAPRADVVKTPAPAPAPRLLNKPAVPFHEMGEVHRTGHMLPAVTRR